jgi:ATP-dependent exoDNAse (exonuclease V) beta subunit
MEQLFSAEKTPSVVHAFEAWMARGISASSLNELTSMPDRFYQKRLVRVKEEDEVEEQVSAMVMGNLIHKGLEKVYEPHVGKSLKHIDVELWTEQAYKAGFNYLIEVERYSKNALTQGRNLLTLEICKKMIRQFLQYDARRAAQGALILKGVETKLDFEMQHPTLKLPMKFSGVVDRLEVYDNAFIIWDYKSGAIGPSDLSLTRIDDLWKGSKGKPLQILLYAWLLWKKELVTHPFPWQSGMFKLQSGQPEHLLRGAALDKSNDITEGLLIDFEQALCDYLSEVHSNGLPFVEIPRYEFK